MIKRFLGTVLVLCLALSAAAAQAAPAAIVPSEALLRSLDGVYQADSGQWQILAPETRAALDRLASGGIRTPGKTQLFFYVELNVDAASSRVTPVLTLLVFGQHIPDLTAVSFGLNGTRYDIPVSIGTLELGGLQAQTLRAALDQDGLAMLRSLESAPEIAVRLYGRSTASFTVSWESEVRRSSLSQPDWSDMLRASLDGIAPILSRMNALGMDAYDLWDQNATAWEALSGFEPQVDIVAAQDADVMSMWLPEDRNDEIVDLQELLAARNLYYGPITGSYNALTRQAVLRLQALEGMAATGAADQRVLRALTSLARSPLAQPASADLPPSKGEDAAFGTPYALGSLAVLTVERYWYARSVYPAHQNDPLLGVTVQNTDNALLAVEGVLQNLDTAALDLYWQMPATLLYDDLYAFPCTVQRERDQGTRFDSQLLPLEEARVVLCAELPESVIQSDKSLVLEISMKDETLQFTLR